MRTDSWLTILGNALLLLKVCALPNWMIRERMQETQVGRLAFIGRHGVPRTRQEVLRQLIWELLFM
jgi:hypothetical protein